MQTNPEGELSDLLTNSTIIKKIKIIFQCIFSQRVIFVSVNGTEYADLLNEKNDKNSNKLTLKTISETN